MVFVVDKPENEKSHDSKLKDKATVLGVPFKVVDSVEAANEARSELK